MKKILITLIKIGLAAAIVGYLVWRAWENDAFDELARQSKNWWLLAVALAACASAVLLTMIRWYYLVRALELPFTLKDALRLGFLGYLFNLAPMGIVGGDLLKAVMLARHHPDRRPEAVATVFVDRIIGLYFLFVVASVAILATGFWDSPDGKILRMCQATLALTVIGGVGIAAVLMPDLSKGRTTMMLARVPYAGPTLEKLAEAVKMYRSKKHVLLGAALMSVGVHSLFTAGIFLIASGLYDTVPSFRMHFVLSPVSAATGVIPLPMGPFEAVLDYLYTKVPAAGGAVTPGQGLVVALGYRVCTLMIAAVGICYYLSSREEVAKYLHEAKAEAEQDEAEQDEAEQDEAEQDEGAEGESEPKRIDTEDEDGKNDDEGIDRKRSA